MDTKFERFLKKPIASTLMAILAGLIVAGIVLAFAGYNPFSAIGYLLYGMFGRPKYISNVIIKSTPLIITGLSVAFAYKLGLFNIGVEGQFIMGAIAANAVGYFVNLPWILEIPLILIAGFLAGALYGGFTGWLKAKFDINEVITGIMLNWIALYFQNFVVDLDGFHKPDTSGTYPINESGYITFMDSWKTTESARTFFEEHAILGDIMRTDLNFGFIIAIIVAALVAYFLFKTVKGYELRAVGFSQTAAEFAGIDVRKTVTQTMFLAGGLAGLAAACNIMGVFPHNISTLTAFESYGLNGMCVAFIAGGSPLGCVLAGLLYGGLLYGGQSLTYYVGAPSEIINIMIGTIVFFIGLEGLVGMYVEHRQKKRMKEEAEIKKPSDGSKPPEGSVEA